MLILTWQYHNLRLKLVHLPHLSSCSHVRQSLLLPAAYIYDEVERHHTLTGGEDIAQAIATVRLPQCLSLIRTLVFFFREASDDSISTTASECWDAAGHAHLLTSVPVSHATLSSSSSSQPSDVQGGSAIVTLPERSVTVDIASLMHLRTLVLLNLSCAKCSTIPAIDENEMKERSNVVFPRLLHLKVLMLDGGIDYHCLPHCCYPFLPSAHA